MGKKYEEIRIIVDASNPDNKAVLARLRALPWGEKSRFCLSAIKEKINSYTENTDTGTTDTDEIISMLNKLVSKAATIDNRLLTVKDNVSDLSYMVNKLCSKGMPEQSANRTADDDANTAELDAALKFISSLE